MKLIPQLLALPILTFALALACPAQAIPTTDEPVATSPLARAPKPLLQELNVNLFRSPSMGLEYRVGPFSVHAGAYPTVISKDAAGKNETSWFLRAGVTVYFLGYSFYGQRQSEFFVSGSYLRGLNLGHKHGAAVELGYRWMVWEGLNLRLGAAVLLEPGRKVAVNPTPGIGWSHAF